MLSNRRSRLRSGIILTIVCLLWLIPILILFSSSLSNNEAVMKEGYSLFPREFDLTAYRYLFTRSGAILKSLLLSLLVMAAGTLCSILITALLAYPLSQKKLRGRGLVTVLIIFTLLFNGGLVPTYMIYTQIFDVRDTFFALIVPNLLVSGFNVLLMRTYFVSSVPPVLLEAAELDGIGPVGAFFRIVLPLSLPLFATVGLLQATMYWNDWFNALLYIRDTDLMSLQAVMNQMLNNINFLSSLSQGGISAALGGVQASPPTATIRMAMAVIGILPTIIVFPFAQKYLIRGLTIGGIKE